MKVLIIGGSYFLGRVFVMLASKEHELTLINRGTYSMSQFGVTEYKLDRNDIEALKQLPKEDYDVVVDFCAYNPNEVKKVITYLPGNIQKYVLISTADVYERGIDGKKAEKTSLSTIFYEGEAGAYIHGKIQLEKELIKECKEKKISYAILRPTIIYGPYNYAPRESEYIREIIQEGKVIFPENADGKFQFVYVKDVANAILQIMQKDEEEQIYNICSSEISDYSSFLSVLNRVSTYPFETEYATIEQILQKGILAPFPLTKEETELYDGTKFEEKFGFQYTALEDGMKKTFKAFENVFK